MNILYLAYTNPIINLKTVSGFSGVISYYLRKTLLEDKDINLIHLKLDKKILSKEIEEQKKYFNKIIPKNINHVIAPAVDFFRGYPKEVYNIFKEKISGLVTQTGDRPRYNYVDIVFCFTKPPKPSKKFIYIGWGANPNLCFPDKNNEFLHILIDHPQLPGKEDWSSSIIKQVQSFMKNKKLLNELNKKYNKNFKALKVRRFICHGKGIEDLNPNDKFGISEIVEKNLISYPEICKEYRKAHIFIAPHGGSCELSIIESAKSGALILIPEGIFQPYRLETVRHLLFGKCINWEKVFGKINIAKSVEKTKNLTWKNVFKKLIKTLKNYKESDYEITKKI